MCQTILETPTAFTPVIVISKLDPLVNPYLTDKKTEPGKFKITQWDLINYDVNSSNLVVELMSLTTALLDTCPSSIP